MKVAIAQLNPTVGDLRGNTERILENLARAGTQGAALAVFPELAVTGYPARDLLCRTDFVTAVERMVYERIVPAVGETAALVGAPLRDGDGRLQNRALLIHRGRVLGWAAKTLLPDYDVFDESRYFAPAREHVPLALNGLRLGVTVCEDIWNDKDFWPRPNYPVDPVAELASQGIDMIVNLSASPYHHGKRRLREDMVCAIAGKYARPVVYANQVGANDELIFDGGSFVADPRGRVIARAPSFEEALLVADPAPGERHAEPLPAVQESVGDIFRALVLGLGDYLRKTGFRRAVVGLSGGIDSALTAALAAAALGPENVVGISMPSRYSSPGSLEDARALARNLGIEYRVYPIDGIFARCLDVLNQGEEPRLDVAEENVQARIRGNILMFVSNREGALVLSTGNKSELAVGYCTLYGDMSGGLAVLADVPKTMVYELAYYINRERVVIPENTLVKPPSAELRPDQRDEDSLPPYAVLDPILRAYVEEQCSEEEIIAVLGYSRELVRRVIRMVDRAEYKRRQAAPGLRVTSKAFGWGRRMPIAQGWDGRS
ncbi:MAG: NAD+ synthase [Thermoanaerobacterales bacterium]|nr:NAD+ synthase [Thermoanaerobacterales bacterium]